MYAFFAGFAYYFETDVIYDDPYAQFSQDSKDKFIMVYWIIEISYMCDFIAQFFLEYVPSG